MPSLADIIDQRNELLNYLSNLLPHPDHCFAQRMSYIPVPKESHFSINNIPFGIFSSVTDSAPRPATAIGEFVLDLSVLAKQGAFSKVPGFDSSTLQQVTPREKKTFS